MFLANTSHAAVRNERWDIFNEEIESVRNADSLPPHFSEYWDREIVSVMKRDHSLFDFMTSRLAVTTMLKDRTYHWWTGTDEEGGVWSMDFEPDVPIIEGEITEHNVPVPVFRHKWGWKYREAMAVIGDDRMNLGAEDRRKAIWSARDAGEMMCLYGPKVAKSYVADGLLTYPQKNTISGNTDFGFDLYGATGNQWKDLILKMCDKMAEKEHDKFPDVLIVNNRDWKWAQATPYVTGGPNAAGSIVSGTIASFVMGMVDEVLIVDALPRNNLVLLAVDTQVVALPYAMPIMTRPLPRIDVRDPFQFMVEGVFSMACKSDDNGQCGIVHAHKGDTAPARPAA